MTDTGSARSPFRHVLTSLPLILVVALALRVGFAWDYQRHFSRQALSVIPFLFESGNIAYSIATGHGFSAPFHVPTGPTAWTTPAYPLLLAGLMRIWGTYTFPTYLAAVSLNMAFSTAACIPIFFAGKRMGGRGLAALAAWLWAVFPNAILLTFESMWETSLSALLGATLLWATLCVAESRRPRAWAAYGLLWGAALMTNAVLVSLLPFLAGWAMWRVDRVGRPWVRNAGLAAAIAVLCCLPWTIRNYQVLHSFIPLRSILGLQLWVGNNPQARVVWLGGQHPINDTPEREKYVEMGEPAYMRQKEQGALRYMVSHPRQEASLIGGRFVSLWAGGSADPLRDWRRNHSLWFRFVLLFNLGLAVGTVVGIVHLCRVGSVYTLPMAVYPIVLPWAYYLTVSLPRYRHPIDPVLMLLTGVALLA